MHFNINLTSLAIILWSGMLIISGSIWVLCSQVRKLSDVLEDHSRAAASAEATGYEVRLAATSATVRVGRRGAPVRLRGASRLAVASNRVQAQLIAPRRPSPERNDGSAAS